MFSGKASATIANLLKPRKNHYNLRGTNVLTLPKVNSSKYGLNSFKYYAAKVWNTLPDHIRTMADMAGNKEFLTNIQKINF